MIKKFLYHFNKDKHKILSGMIEDDRESNYSSMDRYPLALEDSNPIPGERKIINKGHVGYMVFRGDEDKYIDVNIFDGMVKIALTTNISHAACYSKEFFASILDHTNYFDLDDDPEFVDSGLTLIDDMYQDSYQIFKGLRDASYCKINKGSDVYFVSRDDNQKYYLTTKLEDASKVNKNELRRVLIINGFINAKTSKNDVSFSTLKYLTNADGAFVYAGRNPFLMEYSNDNLKLTLNPIITPDFKLRDNEEVFLQLKDISYLISKEKSEKNFYLEVSNKYVVKNDILSYSLVSNPSDATPLNDYDIEIFKSAYKLISPEAHIQRRSKNYFLYEDGNTYKIYLNADSSFEKGRMIDSKEVDMFMQAFDISFNTALRSRGTILICNDNYLNIEIISKKEFKVLLTKSAYNASVFNADETKAIKAILGFKFSERNIENLLLKDLKLYNIFQGKADIANEYRNIVNEIISKKTVFADYKDDKSLRYETEKASLEYLRRFYLKSVFDYKSLFEKVLTPDTKKVLIIAPLYNLELQGLDLAAKTKIEVTTLNEMKFGYSPKIYLENISFKATYRLKLANLPKSFVDQFDLILFGAGFNEDVCEFSPTLDSIVNGSNITILQSRIVSAHDDNIYEYFKDKAEIARKIYTYDFPYPELVDELDQKYINYFVKNGGRTFAKVSVDKKDSYYSIIKIRNSQIG